MDRMRSIAILLVFCFALLGEVASQGMGDSRAYDRGGQGMGTPAYEIDPVSTISPDYLSPVQSVWPESRLGNDGGYGGLRIELADPAAEGLVLNENQSQANELYMQTGNQLLTQSAAMLGEDYDLWARVVSRGSFQLYDSSSLLLSGTAVTPGWYRIKGIYGSYLGQHLYRFQVAGLSSNDLFVIVSSGSYPTSFSLTGKVTDESGRGLTAARVVLTNSDGGRFTTTTDAAGFYALDVAAGFYTVNTEHPGYAFDSRSVQARAGTVSAARPLVGRPLSGTGAPGLPAVFS